jgi:hypothetical protein
MLIPSYRSHVRQRNTNEGVHVLRLLVDLPEMQVHAQGKDLQEDKLETVCYQVCVGVGVIGRNAQTNLEMRTLGTWHGTGTECAEY